MTLKIVFIVTVFCLLSVTKASLAPFITPCKWDDSKCNLASATKAVPIIAEGVPELGVENLNPLHFKRVDSSTDNLKFILSDVTIEGLKNCEVTNLERDASSSKIKLTLVCSVKLDGNYELDGNLLLLNLKGNGKIHVSLYKAVFNLEFVIVTKTGADGEKYWHIKRFHHSYDLLKKSDVEFENLFQDDDVAGQATKDFIKENGNDIVKTIGNPMILETITRIVKNIGHMFDKVPVKHLSLD